MSEDMPAKAAMPVARGEKLLSIADCFGYSFGMNLRNISVSLAVVILLGVVVFRVKAVLGKDVVKEPTTQPAGAVADKPSGPLAFTMKDIDGKEVDLSTYKGKAVLIVNVASRCGFTPQYAGLEKLYEKYKDQGFVILGFPANNFGSQEPGSDMEIKSFCTGKYNVSFPMMSKISVKGDDKHPLYKFLTEPVTAGDFAGDVGWNFTKFLVDRNGNIMGRFASNTKPDDAKLVAAVESAISAK